MGRLIHWTVCITGIRPTWRCYDNPCLTSSGWIRLSDAHFASGQSRQLSCQNNELIRIQYTLDSYSQNIVKVNTTLLLYTKPGETRRDKTARRRFIISSDRWYNDRSHFWLSYVKYQKTQPTYIQSSIKMKFCKRLKTLKNDIFWSKNVIFEHF